MSGPPLDVREHVVDGLYVREVAPALPGGMATPLLFVPGSQHGAWAWERWQGLFAAFGWRSFAMSLRNHTFSRRVPEAEFLRLSVSDYADDVRAVARFLGAPAVLIGHSMGGIVVQKAAERDGAAALVLVASVGPAPFGPMREPVPTDAPVAYGRDAVGEKWLRETTGDALDAFHAKLCPESPGVINEYSAGVAVERARIACPVLVVGGAEDRTTVPRAPDLARHYGAPCLELAGAAHNFMMESEALPAAIRVNQWLLEVAGEGLRPLTASGA